MKRFFQFPWRSDRIIRADVDDELKFHMDSRVDELVRRGVDREAAYAQAIREFGDVEDARRWLRVLDRHTEGQIRKRTYMNEFLQDVRYALRALGAAPAFAVTAIVTLALGVGANTAMFSVVHSVVLRPLPFPQPEALFAVYSANRTAGQLQAGVSAVDLDDWRAQRKDIRDLGGYFYAEGSTGVNLTGRGTPRRLNAVFITPGFFSTLGPAARFGRLPDEHELVRGGPDRILVLSHGFWLREFGGSSAVIHSSVTINDSAYEIIGVLPPDFRFPTDSTDVYVPFSTIPDSGIPRIRPVRILSVVARARPGVKLSAVQAEMNTIARRLAEQYADDRAWGEATVLPLHDVIVGPVRRSLVVLLGAVGFVLLMACVNVSSLQLARTTARGREIAVRAALGAGRGRIVRQLLTENLVLAAIGGLLGVAVAKLLVVGLLLLAGDQLPRAAEVRIDSVVLMFALAVSLLTALLVGLAPAVRLTSTDLQKTLREGGRTLGGAGSTRWRASLTIVEVALAVVLVVGAGLMARSFAVLAHVDPGFRADRLLAVQFTIDPARHSLAVPPGSTVTSPYLVYYQELLEKIRTLPGVVAVAAVKDPPLRGNGERTSFTLPGRPVPAGEDPPSATAIHVSYGYFATIGARMVDGREFTPQDRRGAPFAFVVNEAFARTFFPGERTVGKRFPLGGTAFVEIIGVVNDIRQVAMAEPAVPTIYFHNLQNTRIKTTLVVRTQGPPLALANTVRDAIWSIDPNQVITSVFTFDENVSRALGRPRVVAVLLAAFGALGLLLGVVGIYGLLAEFVSQRRRDIGVRMALGASARDVRTLFMTQGIKLSLAGIGFGLVAAFAMSRALTTVLYHVSPADPASFIGAAGVLLVAALLASWLPAQRASRVDPVQTLRAD